MRFLETISSSEQSRDIQWDGKELLTAHFSKE